MGDANWDQVQKDAERRGRFKALELLCDTAVFPLGKPLPALRLDDVLVWAWTEELEAKIQKKFWEQGRRKLNRGLEEWTLVLRYCNARLEHPSHADDADMLGRILDLESVKAQIRKIEQLSMRLDMDCLSI